MARPVGGGGGAGECESDGGGGADAPPERILREAVVDADGFYAWVNAQDSTAGLRQLLYVDDFPADANDACATLAPDRVHQGDCLDLLGRMADSSVHLAFADPPFNIGYTYDVYQDRRAGDDYLSWTDQWLRGVQRVLKLQHRTSMISLSRLLLLILPCLTL